MFRRSRGKRHIHKADLILRKREALSRRMGGTLQTSGPSFETGLAALLRMRFFGQERIFS
ncbi:hypothetical protein ROS1_13360 [Roseibium sp. ROS1]